MSVLRNCPNCGGYLNDSGRCEFCGSKVYDFINIDFDKNAKTYIRVKYNGKIVLMPVVFTDYRYDSMCDTVDISSYNVYFKPYAEIGGTLDFYVVGDIIAEKEENT